MKAVFINQYTKASTGNTVFRYGVRGTAKELESYKATQGDNYRTDKNTGEPIFFSSKFVGDSVNLITTEKGKVIADMSEYNKAKSLCEQFGGDFGSAMANALVAKLTGAHASSSVAPAEKVASASAEGIDKA